MDHPRLGEGAIAAWAGLGGIVGPSPRGRGNRLEIPLLRQIVGCIPGWAGKPRLRPAKKKPAQGFPRAGLLSRRKR
jgi:hypothetical protein